MFRKPDPIYVIFRNGKRWRHFTSRQNAICYLAACCDLCLDDHWVLKTIDVEEVLDNE